MPFGLQPIHLVAIFVVALLIFGPRLLPEIGRGIGKSINEFRKGAREMTEGLREEISRPHQAAQATAAAAPAAHSAPMATSVTPVQTASGNFCPNCGNANPVEGRFCNKCGTPLPA